jgi:CDP-diacylglycerol--glycerol-3-phosphate 3-phosphatidyltransferase
MTSASSPRRPRSIREDAINLPNLLTMLRIVLIPVVLWLLADGTREASFWAAVLYIASAVTDFLDGWLARRQGLISVLGKFLDPLADKLLVMATLVFMVHMGRLPLLGVIAVILLIGRELSITSLRTISMSEGVVIAAGQGGKEKTALQMVAILLLILHYPYDIDFLFASVRADLNKAGLLLLYGSVVLAFTSAGEYVRLFVEAVDAKERRLAEREGTGRAESDPSQADSSSPEP